MSVLEWQEAPACVRRVSSFAELARAEFSGGVNALCWPRVLPGDYAEIVRLLPVAEGIHSISGDQLRALPLSPAGDVAREVILADLAALRDLELDPVLDCIRGFQRDARGGPVLTDVYSWHADSATAPADTWLCTYHGACSEAIAGEDALRLVDVPEVRAALLQTWGGADDADFAEYLNDHCYDLHYQLQPGARPYAFGTGNLWRIAVEWDGCPVPPCIHRAPMAPPEEPRLLLLS